MSAHKASLRHVARTAIPAFILVRQPRLHVLLKRRALHCQPVHRRILFLQSPLQVTNQPLLNLLQFIQRVLMLLFPDAVFKLLMLVDPLNGL